MTIRRENGKCDYSTTTTLTEEYLLIKYPRRAVHRDDFNFPRRLLKMVSKSGAKSAI
jgi:hypothetical protein